MDRLLRPSIVRRTAVLAFERFLFVRRHFVGGHEFPPGETRGALERGRAAEIPDPLKIGMTVLQPWQLRRRLLHLCERRPRRNHEREGDDGYEPKVPIHMPRRLYLPRTTRNADGVSAFP